MTKPPEYFTGEKALTKAEFDKLLSVVDNSEDRLLLLIGAGLGIRRFDMSRITVGNINFAEHTLTYLEKKKHDIPHTVPMPSKLEQELQIFIREKKLGLGDRLFSIKDRQLCNHFYKMLDKAGIERRGIHSLRGTCVKLCQANNWTIEQCARLINDRVTTVQIHYSKPSMSEMKEVMKEKEIL
jgi:integrase